MKQESNRQTTMEDIDGGLHPAVDGQSLDEDEDSISEFAHHLNAEAEEFPRTTTVYKVFFLVCFYYLFFVFVFVAVCAGKDVVQCHNSYFSLFNISVFPHVVLYESAYCLKKKEGGGGGCIASFSKF